MVDNNEISVSQVNALFITSIWLCGKRVQILPETPYPHLCCVEDIHSSMLVCLEKNDIPREKSREKAACMVTSS
jgi:hypothetical protein